MTSFIVWSVLMIVAVVALAAMGRRSHRILGQAENIAEHTLQEIGEIAGRKHVEKFGHHPTMPPGQAQDDWYPPNKKSKRT